MAMKAIEDHGAQLFCILARSPDLNPLENVFHVVKSNLEKQVRAREINHETLTEFKGRVCKTLLDTSVDYINNPRADGAKRRTRVLIPPGYSHLGKRKH
jgi:prenyltransferase beta subunit